MIVKKNLISLSPRFNSKVSAIEEEKGLDTFLMNEMYGSLIEYEMTIGKNKYSNRYLVFKYSKINKVKSNSEEEDISNPEDSSFIWRLKRG